MTSHPAAVSTILSIRGNGKLSLGQALLTGEVYAHSPFPAFLLHHYNI
jgi:hypothetical protein